MVDIIKRQIVDGPSRERLIDGLKYTYDRDLDLLVGFSVESDATKIGSPKYFVAVEGLFHEDGSGYSFGFYGHLKRLEYAGGLRSSTIPANMRYVRGYIHTASPRHGFIEFSSERIGFHNP